MSYGSLVVFGMRELETEWNSSFCSDGMEWNGLSLLLLLSECDSSCLYILTILNQTFRFHEFLKQENEIGNITRQEYYLPIKI